MSKDVKIKIPIVNICLRNECGLRKDVIDTLNHFHFSKIKLTSDPSEVVIVAAVSSVSICKSVDKKNNKLFSDNPFLIIQEELSRYKRPSEKLVSNRRAPTPKHLAPFIDILADRIEQDVLEFMGTAQADENKPFGISISHDVDGVGRFYEGSLKSGLVFLRNALRSWDKPKLALNFLAKGVHFLSGRVDYYGFNLILEVAREYQFRPVLFFYAKLKNNNGLNLFESIKGVNPNYSLPKLKKVADALKSFGAEIGLHGSYKSSNNFDLFKSEKEELERCFDINCESTRQHFLNTHGGISLDIYSRVGIKYDFTCGTVYENAFLCGTCRPFYYEHPQTGNSIIIIPMIFMDAVSLYFKPACEDDICVEINYLLSVLKHYGGYASFNFHQRMISAVPEIHRIYKYLIRKCIEMDGKILCPRDLKTIYEM